MEGVSIGMDGVWISEKHILKENEDPFNDAVADRSVDNTRQDIKFNDPANFVNWLTSLFKASFRLTKSQSDVFLFAGRQIALGGSAIVCFHTTGCVLRIVDPTLALAIVPVTGAAKLNNVLGQTVGCRESNSAGIFVPRGASGVLTLTAGRYFMIGLDQFRFEKTLVDLVQLAPDSQIIVGTLAHTLPIHRDGIGLSNLLDLHLTALATVKSNPTFCRALELDDFPFRLIALYWRLREQSRATVFEARKPDRSESDLARLCHFIMENLDKSVTMACLSQNTGLSPRSIQDRFREGMGCTPKQWIIRQKLLAVRQKLECGAPGDTVTSVAIQYFSNLGDFSRRYKDFHGELPSDTYRLARQRRASSSIE